jgi:hypothetical protein
VARRSADNARQVTDPIAFAVATQLIGYAIWEAFSLPKPALSFVIELVCSAFTLSRIAAIARLARQYRTSDAL